MNPTSDQIATLFETEKERILFEANGKLEHENRILQICIEDLKIALTEISSRTRRPSKRIGGSAQIVLSAEQMAEIAEKALTTS